MRSEIQYRYHNTHTRRAEEQKGKKGERTDSHRSVAVSVEVHRGQPGSGAHWDGARCGRAGTRGAGTGGTSEAERDRRTARRKEDPRSRTAARSETAGRGVPGREGDRWNQGSGAA
jgi:hypothetical protein